MKLIPLILFICLSTSSFAQDSNIKFQPYRLAFESGYYNADERDAEGYHTQIDFTLSKKNHLINFKLALGLGNRLGPSPEGQNLGEFFVEEIFLPFRYGIVAGQYGYRFDLSDKIMLEPYIGGGVMFANDESYLVLPVSAQLLYALGQRIDLGISGNYYINPLNNFFTVSAAVGYRF